MTGRLLGHYRLAEALGAGGMGIVHKAYDSRLERCVAIKIVAQNHVNDENSHARMLREARTASALNHPHICTIHEVGEQDGEIYIVMELVDGKALNKIVPSNGFNSEKVLSYGLQLADALAHAHDKGIIHRDFKSSNIVVTPEGRAKVLDFGLAKRFFEARSNSEELPTASVQSLTQQGMIVGTLPNMAPELLRGESAATSSDVWALGTVLYEMATGALPFQGKTLFEMSSAILTQEPHFSQHFPVGLKSIIQQCLQKEVANRYRRASEVLAALQAVGSQSEKRSTVSPGSSVAVLDFTNLTGEASIDWLSSGIGETVSVDLSKVSSLKVLSREKIVKTMGDVSRLQFSEERIQELASTFNVHWLLWGSYQKSGNKIRITPRFLDAKSGEVIGSAKIDGSMEDIFQLQDQIISQFLEALHLDVPTAELKKIERPHTVELQAYEYYARGRQMSQLFGKSSFEEAQKLFEKAIDLDSQYALPYSGLGSIYIFKFIAYTDPRDLDIGISNLQKAQQLDPDLGEPYVWLTYGYMRKLLLEDSIQTGCRAVQLQPDDHLAHYFLATTYLVHAFTRFHFDSFRLAKEHFDRSISIHPNYEPPYIQLAWIYFVHGLYESAQDSLEKAVRIEEADAFQGIKFLGALTLMGNLCVRRKEPDEAMGWYVRSLKILERTDHVYREAFIELTYCGQGDVAVMHHEYKEGLQYYQKALDLISRFPKALGVGYFAVKAILGISNCYHFLNQKELSNQYFDRAIELFQNKSEFSFQAIWEASDAQANFSIAEHCALCGDQGKAIQYLQRAVECGWCDRKLLQSSSAFSELQDNPEFLAIANSLNPEARLGISKGSSND